MTIFQPGDVVVAYFPGAHQSKNRPAVVISTALYHSVRPDVVLSLLTRQIAKANAPTDYVVQDWQMAGLRYPSVFRIYHNHLGFPTCVVGPCDRPRLGRDPSSPPTRAGRHLNREGE